MLMVTIVVSLIGLLFVSILPRWLPHRVATLRNRLFTSVNGVEGLMLPNQAIGPEEALRIYKHPNASGRAKGADLSDLFWYWMSPGAHLHQENMEAGPRYDLAKRTTRKLLAVKPTQLFALAERHFSRYTATKVPPRGWDEARLTAWFFPVFAGFYHELLFGREGSPEDLRVLTAHAANFLSALKCNERRDMPTRTAATAIIHRLIANTPEERFEPLSAACSNDEVALYLQGNFFSTGVVQMSEAMAHILLALAKNHEWQERYREEPTREAFVQSLIKEAFRLYPLFGISHRILQADIPLSAGGALSAGTVICLDHHAYNLAAYQDGQRFDPMRWYDKELAKLAIPFGVKENRSCPAEGFVVNLTSFLVPWLLDRYRFVSSVQHDRSLATFGPCFIIGKDHAVPQLRARLWLMRQCDAWRRVSLSLTQLWAGTAMVLEARGMALCKGYFQWAEAKDTVMVVETTAFNAVATAIHHQV